MSESVTPRVAEIRHTWQDRPLDHKWLEGKLFPLGARGPIKSGSERGYSHFVLNEDPQYYVMAGFTQEAERFARHGDRARVEDYINNPKTMLDQEFKIHLQPKRQFVPLMASRLSRLLQSEEVRTLVQEFKVLTDPRRVDSQGQEMAQIVIYPQMGRENAKRLLGLLRDALRDDEKYGSGQTPRYNMRDNNLLFIAQSSGDLKSALAQSGLLDDFFDPNTNHAFMRKEVGYWSNVIGSPRVETSSELTPEALVRAQAFLRIAQAQKLGQNIRFDERTREIARTIQQRIAKGETLDNIIAKSAADLRAIRSRMGLK